MSVHFDYFRAADEATVQARTTELDGGPLVKEGGDTPAFDGVELTDIDPTVVLGQFLAYATDRPWTPELVTPRLIWPAGGDPGPDHEGPWVMALDNTVRNTLAEVPARRLPELGDRWARIEEFGGQADPIDLRSAAERLIALAGRARATGESLYCWTSL